MIDRAVQIGSVQRLDQGSQFEVAGVPADNSRAGQSPRAFSLAVTVGQGRVESVDRPIPRSIASGAVFCCGVASLREFTCSPTRRRANLAASSIHKLYKKDPLRAPQSVFNE
jgi:hypothetical protein